MSLNGERRHTMFGERRWKQLAKVVSLENPAEARSSAVWLKRHFQELKSHEHKVAVKRACVLAANRADAMLKKKDLSRRERGEFRKIVTIYRQAAKQMKF